MIHPVFGPDRPRAAVAAITELRAAEAAAAVWWPQEPTPGTAARLSRAREVRAMYGEYGDTFRGH